MYHDYAPPMRHLPRPRSTTFRIVLAMALLAWATLASGAPRTPGSMGDAHARMNAADVSMHCAGAPQAHATSHLHSAHTTPGGQGDCCHGGCHCLSACSVVLLVPFVALGATPGHKLSPVSGLALRVVPATAAPPLRPPIA